MKKLEIVADADNISLRCKGWCHSYEPKVIYHSDLPDTKYFK